MNETYNVLFCTVDNFNVLGNTNDLDRVIYNLTSKLFRYPRKK